MKARSITISILAVGIMISAATSTWGDNTVPKVDIPEITMPTPNAYDFYIKAMSQRKDNGKVEDTSNSYTLEQRIILSENIVETLATFREGLKHTYLCPPADPADVNYSKIGRLRSLSRLLVFESKLKLDQEKYGEALNVSLDNIQFGADIPRGGNLTNCLVGTAIESMGRYPIWAYLDKLSEVEAKGAALRLENINDSEVPFSQTITNEKWYMEAELVRAIKEGKLEQLVLGTEGTPDWRTLLSLKAQLAITSNQKILDNYDGYMNKCIIAAQFPYGDPQSVVNDNVSLPNDPINRQILPSFVRAQFKRITSVDVQNRLLMTALALHAYNMKYTEYPAQLSALAPEFLNKMPVDPFGNGAFLKYRKDGDSYKLYSIGPDGKDDNGQPVFTKYNSKSDAARQYFVSPDSKGDIVAGINKN